MSLSGSRTALPTSVVAFVCARRESGCIRLLTTEIGVQIHAAAECVGEHQAGGQQPCRERSDDWEPAGNSAAIESRDGVESLRAQSMTLQQRHEAVPAEEI